MPSLSVRAMTLCHLPEKARPLAGVADVAIAQARHLAEACVLIPAGEQLLHPQAVARQLPLRPQGDARQDEELSESPRARPDECPVVHVPAEPHPTARV